MDVGKATGYLDLDTTKWKGGMQSAFADLQTFNDKSSKAADKATALGKSMSGVGKNMTQKLTLPLVAVGAGFIAVTAKFEKAMSQVQATMGASKESMVELEEAAKSAGATTKFSATEAAEALNYLALAGYDTEKQISALPTVLTLAAAGNMDLAYASDLVTDSMAVLSLGVEDLEGYADKLAKTSSKSNTSVSQLGEAVLVAGGQATLAGLDVTELNTALGVLADNGLKGSEGGTALRNTLKNLYTPTKEAKSQMEALGIATANSDGTLRDAQSVLQDLNGSLSGLTEDEKMSAMSKIFDSRTIAAANALLKNSGARWDELSGEIDGAAGSAQKMADTQLDNLSGQLTILKSGLEAVAISFGEILIPYFKSFVESVQKVTTWIGNLSEGQKKVVVTLALFLAALGPVLLITGKLILAIQAIIGVFPALIVGFKALGVAMSANPIGLIVAAVGILIAVLVHLWKTNEGFRTAIIEIWTTIKDTVMGAINTLQAFFTETIPAMIQGIITWFDELPYNAGRIVGEVIVWFSTLPGRIYEWLLATIQKVSEFAANLFTKAKELGQNFVEGAMSYIRNFPTNFQNNMQKIVDFLVGLPEQFLTLGGNIIQGMWDGMKAVWEGLYDWFTGVIDSVKDFIQGVKDGMKEANEAKATGSNGGSFAVGLSYVPVNGFKATLHEGERILTKQQNKEYGTEKNASGGDNYIFNSPVALTAAESARQMKKAKRELVLGF